MKKTIFLLMILFFLFAAEGILANDPNTVYPAERWQYYGCGDSFQIAYVYQPFMTKSSSNMIADGKFILIRVRIKNLSGDYLPNLSPDSFHIAQRAGSREISFSLDEYASARTSVIWDMETLDNEFGTFDELDTWLVFDVNGKAKDPWYLIFTPMDDYNRTSYCTLRLQVPPITNK